MTETRIVRWSLRTIAPLAAAGCAAVVATKAVARRRALARGTLAPDAADRHLAEEQMEALATAEGMAEARER
jgi:hypothetical protein